MNAPRRSRVRVTAMTLALTLLTGLVALLPAATAHAAQYRYWTYWWGTGSGWQYASLGPSYDRGRIKDRSVVGWRFGTTGPNGGGASPPRRSASFSCPAAQPGQISVELIVDFGTAADAPPGDHRPLSNAVQVSCVQLPDGSNGVAVLNTANISVRASSDGLVCGLAGYPSTECAALVADPAPAAAKPTPARSTPAPAATGTTAASPRPTAHSPSPATTTAPTHSPTPSAGTPAATGTTVGVVLPEQTLPAAPAGALSTAASSESSGSPWPVVGVALLLAALGGGIWWRRRSA